MPDFSARVRQTLAAGGRAIDDDIAEELGTHASAAYEAARADGLDHDDALRRVDGLIAAWLADADRLQRRPKRAAAIAAPPADSSAWAGLAHDVRYAMRLLRRQPAFAFIAVLTMALGIGATTTLFSITYGVLLRPLPWPDANRLVRLSESRQGRAPRIRGTITNATYNAWHDRHATVEEIGGWRNVFATAIVRNGAEPVRLQTAAVTPTLFTVLKAVPLRGRLFVDDDGKPGGRFPSRDLIVLSYGLWQEQFGGRDDAIASVVQVDGKPLTVVGVMPREFAFPDRETRAWTPWAISGVVGRDDNGRPYTSVQIFQAMARLRAGATPSQAAAEATARSRGAPDPGLAAVAMFGDNGPAEISAVPAIAMMTADVRPALLILLAAVGLLLVTATANVASLQLARAATRRREIAIRAAIGAGAGRLTRQLVVESSLVGIAGGMAGLACAAALHRALPSLLPADFPRVADVALDARVMAFAAFASLAASIACGLLPALHARRVNLVESLADDGSAPVGGGMRSPTARARMLIMVGQLAVSCVLHVGAALLSRSFVALLHADRGYDPTNVLTARIPLPATYSIERRRDLLETLSSRLRALPGVQEAAFGNALPLVSAGGFRALKMRPPANPAIEVDVNAIERVVSPGYFAALGIRLRAGRAFSDADTPTSPQVIVVNRSFAARYLEGGARLKGSRFEEGIGAVVPNLGMCRGDNDRWQVVGVVDDLRQGGVGEPDQPEVFIPFVQNGCANAVPQPFVLVRTAGDPLPYVAHLRSILRQEAPSLALDSVMTMEDRVTTSLAKPRLYAVVLAGFSVFALTIAGVGLFGVLSYSVAQRVREIGVRTALGARTADIVGLVLRQVAAIAAAGITIGLVASYAASRSLGTVLYGVGPHDVLTFVAVPLVLFVVAAVACLVPARRAAQVDPIRALR